MTVEENGGGGALLGICAGILGQKMSLPELIDLGFSKGDDLPTPFYLKSDKDPLAPLFLQLLSGDPC